MFYIDCIMCGVCVRCYIVATSLKLCVRLIDDWRKGRASHRIVGWQYGAWSKNDNEYANRNQLEKRKVEQVGVPIRGNGDSRKDLPNGERSTQKKAERQHSRNQLNFKNDSLSTTLSRCLGKEK